MSGGDRMRPYGWAIGIGLALLFLLSRAVMQRLGRRAARRQADLVSRGGDHPAIGPEGIARARRQCILTLVLLAIIVIVSILTHLQ